MRNLTAILCLTLAVLLSSAGVSFALPACPDNYSKHTWSDCFGTYTYSSGEKYIGEWKNGKQHGQGTYTYSSGDKYVGEWKNAKRHGQGTYTYAVGEKYVGEYRDDKKHGQGTYTYANGQIQEGIWKDNKFQYAQKVTPPVVARNSPPPSPSADFFEGLTAYRKKDYATALRIWTPLAEQGHAGAQLNLGVMYENGYGVLQDQRTGTKWTRLAAERGHGNFSDTAKWSLGLMYAKGQGVIKDYVYAHMWWNIAASSGNPLIVPDAIKFRDMVYEQMSPADRSKSQDLARECVRKKYKGC
jgi:hypothetical protein